jgi:hypothetical protein
MQNSDFDRNRHLLLPAGRRMRRPYRVVAAWERITPVSLLKAGDTIRNLAVN